MLSRVIPPTLTLVLLATLAAALFWHPAWWIAVAVFAAVTALAWYDVLQRRHSILRNYPVLGHLRFLLEDDPARDPAVLHRAQLRRPPVRPRHPLVDLRARQGHPRRAGRSAPSATSTRSATSTCVHSTAPRRPADEPPRVRIGGPDCTQPYDMALLNVSAMSFGALSANAIRALNAGARARRLRPRHRRGRPDQLPPRARRRPGLGDRQRLLRRPHQGRRLRPRHVRATRPPHDQVKMRLAQAEPGRQARHRRRAARPPRSPRRSPRRAACRRARSASVPPRTRSSRTPRELVQFIARMRELAGGKPAGFKLCVGSRADFLGDLQGDGRRGQSPPTSSSSTAPRAAPAPRRWSTRTTSARRSPRA